jgi:hypothetical protein
LPILRIRWERFGSDMIEIGPQIWRWASRDVVPAPRLS